MAFSDTQYWTGLHGSALALAIAEAAKDCAGTLMVVVPSVGQLLQLEQDIGFFTAGTDTEILTLHDWETLPYDHVSPSRELLSLRMRALYRLPHLQRAIVLVSAQVLMQKLPPRSYLQTRALMLRVGQTCDPIELHRQFVEAGYQPVATVGRHGECALRGSLLDFYPMGDANPLRVDFYDDEVESISYFDPETQRSDKKVDQIELLPAQEFPFSVSDRSDFLHNFCVQFPRTARNSPIYRDVNQGIAPAGIEYYIPLFFDQMCSLFDYLSAVCTPLLLTGWQAELVDYCEQIAYRHEQYRHDLQRPLLDQAQLFFTMEEVVTSLASYSCIEQIEADVPADGAVCDFGSREPKHYVGQTHDQVIAEVAQTYADQTTRVLFSATSEGRCEMLRTLLGASGLAPEPIVSWQEFIDTDLPCALVHAPLMSGLELPQRDLAIVCEVELLGDSGAVQARRSAKRTADTIIANLHDLAIGTPVVHVDHGVGFYCGLSRLVAGGVEAEYATISYAGGDKLHVPITSLDCISRYTGSDQDSVTEHKLGSDRWQKQKRAAASRVRDVAAELLNIYAHRSLESGHCFGLDQAEYTRFRAAFDYPETEDQTSAIEDVLADMQSARAMDRIICGDVGFGKTEVAMRAAFVAAHDGKQVALLVPTTFLASQHFQTFRDRFSGWPVVIRMLSRISGAKDQLQTRADLGDGKVDIVVGTHKLLQKNLKIPNLGLVIIDEEHRFGVRAKEHLKSLRGDVDVLSLTATPIPRTLNMSLLGLRDLSVIATAPAGRLRIETFVCRWQDALIREAIMRELHRGGLVYFVHNRVQTIESTAHMLRQSIPEARVCVAHGQMSEHDMERAIVDFYNARYNLLVCTTIIESGIDIPNANTIIINRADHFGLAQLHQLRGRVGRSSQRAYAYLIVPEEESMTADALKRIEAIQSLGDVGIGFTLVSHDMEVRGVGELLGDDQSGHIQSIGFNMYNDLLSRAVQALQSGESPTLESESDRVEVDLSLPTLLPESYVGDVHTRLVLYKRISHAAKLSELDALQVELIDRFGLLPEAAKNLFAAAAIRVRCQAIGIHRCIGNAQGGTLHFFDTVNVNPERIVILVQSAPEIYRLDSGHKLRFSQKLDEGTSRLKFIDQLLAALEGECTHG